MQKVAVIPGDGVGVEVAAEALRVLQALAVPLELETFDYSAERYLRTGVALPEGQVERFRDGYDAILFGAIGDPRVEDNAHARKILLALRFGLDLFVNFRPCVLLADRLSPLVGKGTREIDFTIFRENTEGMYGAAGEVAREGTQHEVAIAHEVSTRRGVQRIIEAAFSWAREHGKTTVALADKSNAIRAHTLWLRTFREVASRYPEIEATHFYVDALAMHMVRSPETLQVIVTTNLFGDILSDLGAALIGGMGLAPSANLNPESTPLFEPVHGSAPQLAGKGVVNPFAMFLSCSLMLDHLGHGAAASRLHDAVRTCVEVGEGTRDIGGTLSTSESTDAVLRRLR